MRPYQKVRSSKLNPIEAVADPHLVEEGHLAPIIAIARPYRRASLGPDKQKSSIREKDLRRLRDKYFIFDDIRLTIPGLKELVLSPPLEWITFFEDALDARFWFPLHPFSRNILDYYKVTSNQFFLNGFRVIISFILICHLEVEPRCSLF